MAFNKTRGGLPFFKFATGLDSFSIVARSGTQLNSFVGRIGCQPRASAASSDLPLEFRKARGLQLGSHVVFDVAMMKEGVDWLPGGVEDASRLCGEYLNLPSLIGPKCQTRLWRSKQSFNFGQRSRYLR